MIHIDAIRSSNASTAGNTTRSSSRDRPINCVIQNIIYSNAIRPSNTSTAGNTTRLSS